MSTLISLQQLVAAYRADGIPPERAIHYITQSRLSCRNSRGKGYKAAKRVEKLGQQTAASLERLAKRMAVAHREERLAAIAENRQEARSFAHHYRTQIHE